MAKNLTSAFLTRSMPGGISRAKVISPSKLAPFKHRSTFGRDDSKPYYDFLAHLVQATKANLVVELGTCTGGSTSYLACSGAVRVVSIHIEQQSKVREALKSFPNVELWERDTRDPDLLADLRKLGPIDILFIDTLHTPEQAGFELEQWGPLVRKGGLILLDDIRIDNAMATWWEGLDRDKLSLPHLHWSGFGVIF